MTLEKLINNDLKEAMLAKDRRKLEALRAIKAALLLEKTGTDINGSEIPESLELKLLQKLVKQRRDSAAIFREQNRVDLAEEEEYQAAIIQKYLPEQMTQEEIEQQLKEIIATTGAASMKDMGRVMGLASKQMAGKADNKIVAAAVKKLLS